jgi:hypothetical protein
MEKSDSIKNLALALSSFQATVEAVKKDSDNPFFHSKYASLDNTLATIKEPLIEAELAISQFPDGNGLTTILMHTVSGEWIQSTMSVPLAKNDPQGAGSAITYMRRYALGAILGLATETDDDGNTASTPATGTKTAPRPAQKATGVQGAQGDPFAPEGDFTI